jgi:hypothetical protein
MSERSAAFHRRTRQRAIAAVDVRWIRNVIATLAAGVVLGFVRSGKMEVPNVLTFLENAIVTATFIVLWESVRFLRQRFWIVPFVEFQEQAEQITRLEKDHEARIDELKAETATLRKLARG